MLARNRLVRSQVLGVLATLWMVLSSLSQAKEPQAPNPLLRAPDHVLVWSQRADALQLVFRDLGFTIRKGQSYPEGMSSSTVVFSDWSYLELLHFSDPAKASSSAQAKAELEFVARGPGANSFAVQVADIDAAAELLRRRGFQIADLKPDTVDPDGPSGPEPPRPASWRDFHFASSPVAGVELFFIQYPPEPPASPQDDARFQLRSTHANNARRLSAAWVQIQDLKAEAEVYRRMGFAIGSEFAVEHLNARACVASLGTGAVVLVQSARLPAIYRVRHRSGARIIGLSFEVTSIGTARQTLSLRHKNQLRDIQSPFGRAVVLPMSEQLGMYVEFHEPAAAPRN